MTTTARVAPDGHGFALLVALIAAAAMAGVGLLAGDVAGHLAGWHGTAAHAAGWAGAVLLGGYSAAASAHHRVRQARRRRMAPQR